MSNNALQVQQPAQTVEAKDVIEFVPWGTEDKIKLSLNIVRNTIAVVAYDRETHAELLPDNRECMKFMMLCRSRRLNPFEGDAFMVPFWDGKANRYAWSLITAHNAYLKRAEMHPEYDGLQSGVILETANGDYIEIEGDFVPKTHYDEDNQEQVKVSLVGGWARVSFKQRKIPMYRRAALATFAQSFGQWVKNASGMIVKVAEADALRSAFPTLLGGLYLREEIDIESEVTSAPGKIQERRPEFTRGLPAPAIGTETKTAASPASQRTATKPQDKPKAEPATQTPAPAQTSQAAPAAGQAAPNLTVVPKTEEQAEAEAGLAPASSTAISAEDEAALTAPDPEDKQAGEATTEAAAQEQQAPAGPPADKLPVIKESDSKALKAAKGALIAAGVTEGQTIIVLRRKKIAKEQQNLADLAESKLDALTRNIGNFIADIRAVPWE